MTPKTPLTPAMRQWRRVKDDHPGKIVLFRMGDFFEMFGEDARTASRVLEIALTTREKGKADPMPMCGIPYHALEGYLGRLIRAGFKVVLCDQVEDASQAKGLVRREVTRVVTPGTVLEEGVVEGSESVLLASWFPLKDAAGLAWTDLSSGRVTLWQSGKGEALDRLRALAPAEILHPEGLASPPDVPGASLTPLPDHSFLAKDPAGQLARRYRLPGGLPGLPSDRPPLCALLALLDYVEDRGGRTLSLPDYEVPETLLAMDETTRRNLELVSNMERGSKEGSLLGCLDETMTSMGARLLKEWILAPSAVEGEIVARQESVAAWLAAPSALTSLRAALKDSPDLGRLVARFAAHIGSPRDMGRVKEALNRLPEIIAACRRVGEGAEALTAALESSALFKEHLNDRLGKELPPRVGGVGIFAGGWHPRLDELRDLSDNAHRAILALERGEKEATGIGSLKVKYNKIFGYFIEVSKANLARVPPAYERRQTLVNAERFVTPALKELEARIFSARADQEALEEKLWEELQEELIPLLPALRKASGEIARIDILSTFAHQARGRGYCRPEITPDPLISLEESRHPVLELDPRHQPFIPNPAALDGERRQVLLLTGPNMGGKSTYLRQVALITLMAHLGAYVPARRATVGLADRLFCRVGAGDSLIRGLSTFMVEMTETAAILRNATTRSLVILDEVGRGTSTYDGLAIAWAVVEALAGPEGIGCRTLFATHYHELTEMGRTLDPVQNLTMGVREYMGKVHFLRTVEEGASDRSYGIHVAELAGVPPGVVARARAMLEVLEAGREGLRESVPFSSNPRQGNLFRDRSDAEKKVLEALRGADPANLTPVEALLLLDRLKTLLAPEG